MHYGSFDQQHMMCQEDPQEVQREIEALQRVVARTSEYAHSSTAMGRCMADPDAQQHG